MKLSRAFFRHEKPDYGRWPAKDKEDKKAK